MVCVALLLWCEDVEVRGNLEADDSRWGVGIVLGASVNVVDHGGCSEEAGWRLGARCDVNCVCGDAQVIFEGCETADKCR